MYGPSEHVVNAERGLAILRDLGKEPFQFQADLAAQCLRAAAGRQNTLVIAPTGTGKTLIANLMVSLLEIEREERFPRVLVIVPSRSLLLQHVADASWLRRQDIPLHYLSADVPFWLYRSLILNSGVLYTTPITFVHRLRHLEASEVLARLDLAIFDEIDTYLTVGELEEKRDTWHALQYCLDAGVATVGFTGTPLSGAQTKRWKEYGFELRSADIPPEWMPFTIVRFVRITDSAVVKEDEFIKEELKAAYAPLLAEYDSLTLAEVKALAREGDPNALRIMRLSGDRLKLFETLAPGKRTALLDACTADGPVLVLSRYIRSADEIRSVLDREALPVREAHGEMTAAEIGSATTWFRSLGQHDQGGLVLTRELGGRGLDFPHAQRLFMISPRSNYQAVAQELARIRSRQESPKAVYIAYFDRTEEQAKARRLREHLRRIRFGDKRLFQVEDLPAASYRLEGFESRNLGLEEGLDLASDVLTFGPTLC